MNAAFKSKRLYPSYTTAELVAFLATADAATKVKLVEALEQRRTGFAPAMVTPQIEGGKAVPKIGRM